MRKTAEPEWVGYYKVKVSSGVLELGRLTVDLGGVASVLRRRSELVDVGQTSTPTIKAVVPGPTSSRRETQLGHPAAVPGFLLWYSTVGERGKSGPRRSSVRPVRRRKAPKQRRRTPQLASCRPDRKGRSTWSCHKGRFTVGSTYNIVVRPLTPTWPPLSTRGLTALRPPTPV